MNIRQEDMGPHFTKFHLEGPWPFHAVMHRFTRPDHGDPHDHPWSFRTTILHGGYMEEVFGPDGSSSLVTHRAGDSFIVPAIHIHRIVELIEGECWTLIQPQPGENRVPGFYQFRDGKPWHRPWHRSEFLPL